MFAWWVGVVLPALVLCQPPHATPEPCIEKPGKQGLTCRDWDPCPSCKYTCEQVIQAGYDCSCTCFTSPTPTPTRTATPSPSLTATLLPTDPPTPAPTTPSPYPPPFISLSVRTPLNYKDAEQKGIVISIEEKTGNGFTEAFLRDPVTPLLFRGGLSKGIGGLLACCKADYAHTESRRENVVRVRLGPFPVGTVQYQSEVLTAYLPLSAARGPSPAEAKSNTTLVVSPAPIPEPKWVASQPASVVATAAISGGLGSSAGASMAGIALVVGGKCSEFHDLSVILHPTGVSMGSTPLSDYIGCAVTNFLIMSSLLTLHRLCVHGVARLAASPDWTIPIIGAPGRKIVDMHTASAALRWPGGSAMLCVIFYPGLASSAWRLFTHGTFVDPHPLHISLGLLFVCISIALPVCYHKVLSKVPTTMAYRLDSKSSRLVRLLLGPGEWCNRVDDNLFRQRFGVLFMECSEGKVWINSLSALVLSILAVIRGVPKLSFTACALADAFAAAVVFVLGALTLLLTARHRVWDQILVVGAWLCQAAALAFRAAGFVKRHDFEGGLFSVSSIFLQVATALVIAKAAIDMVCFILVLQIGRRSRLQQELDTLVEQELEMRKPVLDLVDVDAKPLLMTNGSMPPTATTTKLTPPPAALQAPALTVQAPSFRKVSEDDDDKVSPPRRRRRLSMLELDDYTSASATEWASDADSHDSGRSSRSNQGLRHPRRARLRRSVSPVMAPPPIPRSPISPSNIGRFPRRDTSSPALSCHEDPAAPRSFTPVRSPTPTAFGTSPLARPRSPAKRPTTPVLYSEDTLVTYEDPNSHSNTDEPTPIEMQPALASTSRSRKKKGRHRRGSIDSTADMLDRTQNGLATTVSAFGGTLGGMGYSSDNNSTMFLDTAYLRDGSMDELTSPIAHTRPRGASRGRPLSPAQW